MKILSGLRGLIIALSCFVLSADRVDAQLINPMGKGLMYPAVALYVDSSQSIKLAVHKLYERKDSLLTRYLISAWSGSEWVTLTSFAARLSDSLQDFDCVKSIAFFKAQVYVGGTFDSVGYPAIPNTALAARWNSAAWNSLSLGIGNHPSARINKMEVFNGKLFAAGQGFFLGTDSFMNVLCWGGSQWSKTGGFGPDSAVYDLKRHNGALWAAGKFYKADTNVTSRALAFFDGTAWKAPNTYPFSQALDIDAGKGDSLYAMTESGSQIYIYRYSAGIWKLLNKNLVDFGLKGTANYIAAVDNRLWLSTETSDPEQSLFYLKDSIWYPLPSESLGRVKITSCRDSLILWGDFKRNEGTFLDGIGIVRADIPDHIRVRGIVYQDVNSNCVYDAGDKPLKNIKLNIQPGNYPAITNSAGEYQRYLPRNPYVIYYTSPQGFMNVCGLDSAYADSAGTFRNFALLGNPTYRNHSVVMNSSTGFKAPKGRVQEMQIHVKNHGIKQDSVVIVLQYDSLLTWKSSSVAPLSKVNNIVTYVLNDIAPLSEKLIKIELEADSTLTAMSALFHQVTLGAMSAAQDDLHVDDIDTMHQFVSAPLDPNDKQSWPVEKIRPGTDVISYTVRFQNIGTDKAIRVRVVDTIDINLPLTKVWIEEASHDYHIYIEGNVFTWVFDNINLPDSASDPKGSQGFLNYSTSIKPGLAIGTEIHNTAMIYFDYEAPVRTNTVRSTLVSDQDGIKQVKALNSNLLVYPNPSADYFVVENKDIVSSGLVLSDILGREIWKGRISGLAKIDINISSIPDGLYFLCNEQGQAVRLLIKH